MNKIIRKNTRNSIKKPEVVGTIADAMEDEILEIERDDSTYEEVLESFSANDSINMGKPKNSVTEFEAVAPTGMEIDWDNFRKISELEEKTCTIIDVSTVTTKFGQKTVFKLELDGEEFFMYGPAGLSNVPYYWNKGEVKTITPYKTQSKKNNTYWSYHEKPERKSDIVSLKDLKGKKILVHGWEKKNTKYGEKYLAYFRFSMEEETLQKTFFPITYTDLLNKIADSCTPEYIEETGVAINIR